MVLELSKSFVHNPACQNEQKYSEDELKNIILDLMQENGINTHNIHASSDGVLELSGLPDIKMHTILLQVEKLGLAVKFTKKTMIEVC